jgi:hypothetical protein
MAEWLTIVSWVAVILGLVTALAIAFDVTAHRPAPAPRPALDAPPDASPRERHSLLSQSDGLTSQVQSAKQLGVYSHDDGRGTHRDGAHTHGEIDRPADEKTPGDRNGNQIISCRPNEILDHLSVSSA